MFVRGTSPLSLLIKQFDRGEFSHVGIMIDEYHILGARYLGGVKVRHFDFTDYEIVRVEDIDVSRAEAYIGTNYDLLQFISYGFKRGENVWNNPNKMICSELVAKAVGREDFINLKPNELYRALVRGGNGVHGTESR